MGLIFDIVWAVLGISVLVIVHETGHYLAARAFKMRVLRYSIGFGPALFKYRPQNSPTTFQVSAVPLLAYVQIAGMNPHEEVDPDDPELYPNKSAFARITTIFAGPLANYMAASVLAFALATTAGWPEQSPTEPMVVSAVSPDSPAAEAGLLSGDVILEANGRPVKNVAELIEVTSVRGGQPTQYIVERDGKRLDPLTITPKGEGDRAIIGVTAQMETRFKPVGLLEATEKALIAPYIITVAQLEGIASQLARGTTEGLMGPVGMGKVLVKHANSGGADFLLLLMVLSVALGFFNLLPLPALDGGRLVFLAYEVVTRRRPNEKFEAAVHTVGLLFLLGVLVLVTFRDVMG